MDLVMRNNIVNQIDQLVYQLYDLTGEEIAVEIFFKTDLGNIEYMLQKPRDINFLKTYQLANNT